jgi:hypothetical protein
MGTARESLGLRHRERGFFSVTAPPGSRREGAVDMNSEKDRNMREFEDAVRRVVQIGRAHV